MYASQDKFNNEWKGDEILGGEEQKRNISFKLIFLGAI